MKYVLLSGAFGGMGRAMTSLLVSKGYGVIALDRRCDSSNPSVFPVLCDITDKNDVIKAREKVLEYTSELFAIIHFAGIYKLDSFVEADHEKLEEVFRINLLGAALVNKHFFSLLGEGGRIIHVTSELAVLDPMPFTGMYAVSKIALDNYAFSLAMELQLKGIGVSVIRAGAVSTSMIGASTDELERFCSSTRLYSCNAKRFKAIVDSVESKSISADRLAMKIYSVLTKRRPRFSYSINRNPLLLLYGALPKALKFKAIKFILR